MAEVLYANISAENEPCVMESVCVACEKSGKTTILLTKIPMFSDIIIVSFECEECGYKNNEVQFGGKIKENGVIITFNAKSMEDLSRQVVRSENCTVKIPELELELPSNKKGTINTLEGFLQNMVDDLGQEQPVRKIMQPELSEKIDQIIQSLTKYKSGENFPFKFILHDPSGNSYIQNTHYPNSDPQLKFQHYQRTIEETEAMGYSVENQKQEIQQEEPVKITQVDNNQVFDGNEEIQAQNRNFNVGMENSVKGESLVFPTQCNACQQMGENKMCSISIPHFKDIIIMAFNCPFCGNRDTEVKSGGSITPKGKRITLYVKDPIDIRRDVFKSETAGLYIPEIDLELQCGTLGGVYSTVEGLLSQILSHLRDNNPFIGDGAEGSFRDKMSDIFGRLEAYQTGNEKFTLIIKDLVDNSFLSNPYHPEKDPNAFAEEFERTQEDNDELGIDTMKTDNYQ